ncbi:MAG: hypothetical protein IH831_11390 [Planctomycetes bacterium]|nr:hypothetical protein [Planctomycetota bacterium]
MAIPHWGGGDEDGASTDETPRLGTGFARKRKTGPFSDIRDSDYRYRVRRQLP